MGKWSFRVGDAEFSDCLSAADFLLRSPNVVSFHWNVGAAALEWNTLDDKQRKVFTSRQRPEPSWTDGLRKLAAGKYAPVPTLKRLPKSFSLKDGMPPVYNQASRGTCAANAATALMEYYLGNR